MNTRARFFDLHSSGEVVRFLKMERPNPKTYVGTGKNKEIHHYVKEWISTWFFMMN
jgi:GTP-binding protein HflX